MGRQDSQVNAAGVGRIRDHLCRISTQYMPAGCKSLAPKLIRLGLDELLRIFVLQFEESFVLMGILVLQVITGIIVRSMVLGNKYQGCMKVMKFVQVILLQR